MGDPAGVGPELCLLLLANEALPDICVPVVYGDAAVLRRVAARLGWPAPAHDVVDFRAVEGEIEPGVVSAACGRAAYRYIAAAIDSALSGQVDAVCTAPIHKEALAVAGIGYPGHTEILTALTRAERSCMMLTAPEITCSLVTGHVGYRDVPGLLSEQAVTDAIELTDAAMRRLRGRAPKLLVCGLNPHAGEHGLFGDSEEERFIIPAVEKARAKGIDIEGPFPPDTAFLPWRRRTADAYICMYHDQGLIPLKALAFDEAVNVTLGLPIIRTSVDHGTAFDIAWQGKASPSSLYEAVKLAARLVRGPT
jgi:4-hydroxythreonine-4-phosphate dehydrogenase